MGICEYSGEKNIVYTTKSLLDKTPGTKHTNFYFSTQPISKLDGDCLLILSKDPQSLKTNPFLKTTSNKTISSQITKQIQVQLPSSKIKCPMGQFIIFNTYSTGLDFHQFAIMFLVEKQYQLYQQDDTSPQNRDEFRRKLRDNFGRIVKEGVLNLAITQFQWKSWISKVSIFRELCAAILQCKSFKSVVFACINEDTQSLYMKTMQQIKQQSHPIPN